MRRLTLSLSIALAGVALSLAETSAVADVELPRAVPTAKLTQQVGLTEIGIEYDCPAASGRKIWGGVIPYDKVWLIGTSPAAKIKFSRDVSLGDTAVAAGTYWLLALPTKSTWTIALNKSVGPLVTAADYKPELDVARLKVAPKASAWRERLVFTFSDISEERASIDLEWASLRVPIPVQVNTSQQVLSSINNLDVTWRSFANAARYMLETKKDYDAGLKYVDEALALKEDWYAMWVKGALFAAKGDFASASEWAERAHELAQKVGNGAYLEPDLSKAVAEWSRKAHRLDKEARPMAKVGASLPANGARNVDVGPAELEATAPPPLKAAATTPPAAKTAATAPPSFKPAADEEPTKPTDDPPLSIRRARLRHR